MSSQNTPVVSITKRAYARGIAQSLQQRGHTRMPDLNTVKLACEHAAGRMAYDPAQGAVPDNDTIKVANDIIHFATALQQRGKVAAANAHGAVFTTVNEVSDDLMAPLVKFAQQKLAEIGATNTEMTNTENTVAAAGQNLDLNQAEAQRRPSNYAETPIGQTSMPSPPNAETGSQMAHPEQQGGASGMSGESFKAAANSDWLKIAMGGNQGPTNVEMSTTVNSMDNAAQHNDIAALENSRRPAPYAVVGQGNANFNEPPAATTGMETPHPGQQGSSGAPSNSVIEASKTAHDVRRQAMYTGTFQALAPYFPNTFTQEKRAHVTQQAMLLNSTDFEQLTGRLQAAKVAATNTRLDDILNTDA